jgi:hypothetical protein
VSEIQIKHEIWQFTVPVVDWKGLLFYNLVLVFIELLCTGM